MEKNTVRQSALLARKKAHESAEGDNGISLLIDTVFSFSKVEIISGYMPIKTEISPLGAMKKLAMSGKRLCLPVVESVGNPLCFKEWTPDSAMISGAFGAKIPKNGLVLKPELLIIPLVAFDRSGARLGYGGGYYDRSLEQLRRRKPTIAVGFAYSSQEVKKVPTERTDQQLDIIVTENEIIYFDN